MSTSTLTDAVIITKKTDAPNTILHSEIEQPRAQRVVAVDVLRGLVMVIMALDHVRDFFSHEATLFDPTDLTQTSPALFLTRWITHFCAPVFVFLAGTGAYLSTARGKTKSELARFLVTRGLWLILLEVTLVRFGWTFNVNYRNTMLQVIWALGWSMIALAGLIFLPRSLLIVLASAMVLLHNLLDGLQADSFGAWRPLWIILHQQNSLEVVSGAHVFIAYPLIPWIGVMALGYAFGELLRGERAKRRRRVLILGICLTTAFIVLRAINLYGDPQPWATQRSLSFTLLSFLNCTKYPPSLLYLLMTLGPALLALALFDRDWGSLSRVVQPLIVFGRVPLFYYLLHLPLIHLLAIALAVIHYGPAVVQQLSPDKLPPDYGYSLPVVYLLWLTVILILYPLCRWFAGVKSRRREPWLSYL